MSAPSSSSLGEEGGRREVGVMRRIETELLINSLCCEQSESEQRESEQNESEQTDVSVV